MRDFTPEEKELIINTPITKACFDVVYDLVAIRDRTFVTDYWDIMINHLESVRWWCTHGKDKEKYFEILVSMLPNSYKVVKL